MCCRALVFTSGPRRLLSALLLVALALVWPASWLRAQASPKSEYRAEALRAVFLVNFVRFTEWPAETLAQGAPCVVGIAGNRSLEDELIGLVAKSSKSARRIHVVRIKNPRDLEGCHVLYISPVANPGEEPGPGAEELLPHVQNKPVLTVSESPSFLSQGGIVNLYPGETHLRFEIAAEAAKANGLVLSSKLLALAVNPPPRGAKP